MADFRRLVAMPREESLSLLASVSFGRVVFTHLALPAIRPVNHLVDRDLIIIRPSDGAAITTSVDPNGGAVVAYEADQIDPGEHLGWSVIVVGRARRVIDPADVDRYQRALRPWILGAYLDVIAIHADMVDGFRLVGREDGGE